MHILSIDEAQQDLLKVLEMVAQGEDVAIGGKYPTLLLKVRSVGNIVDKHGKEAGGSIIIFDPEDESAFEDEAFKPLPDDMIEQMCNGPLFPEEIHATHESR
ncbi:hypothetical protein BSFA1_44060 [Burkholderia sp. SFA1]|uniref:hypothetical protein n=1 Tax=unclassified Caballeronia TaxID=2646786 RepID=UPI001F3973A5|nr:MULTISPECIES: hypothetical protein [unclassified Caballeronia]MCE4545456.1 hypothetical protein [Caballeronia sp. PC1]MCE4570882.1 hypothetical protein [Caballeronia sp. CLC5]BBP99277.1 hypothetical protein BSFA1_44060 [Burkholderia sp. SFA1]